ncbi:hypothetical protein APD45_05590 [Acinetobacter baumannii]|uniref:lytic transglycosylase domain-containing protein n=1 Tax=Acinetobacter baumannii TaxID=470 RepID=UPI0007077FC2|nr:lytic transglycosylase domain-containing protein [Acinetobacter baumannii]KQE41343.1 hypothetical protein APD45_11935 [Acinetobacter baumannii]KQE48211.1 hypothetical protein APD45_05590 [Acinetobacter baumannii]
MANSYKDPYWSGLSAKTEKLLKLPTGLLQNIVMHGEKSNADQVSSAGARTVYQITPTTRNLVLKKYGVDAYSSDKNAAMAAGLLLQESLKRNKGNVEAAIGEYHGGTDRKNWGSQNQAYRKRVVTAQNGGDNYAGSRGDLGIVNPARDEYKANSEKILAEYDRRKKEASQPKPEQSSEYKKKMLLARFDELNPQKTNQPQGLPDFDANGVITYDQPQAAPPTPEPSFADKALGLGETALSAATGATGGMLGMIGGTIGQAGREILAGNFGTPEAAQRISQNAAEGAADLIYAPRTQTGQEYTQALGELSEPLVALTPALSELALAGQAARATAPITQGQAIRAGQAVAPVVERAGQMAARPVQAVANATRSGVQRMGEMVGLRTPEAEGPAPANVGAAQVDQATIRHALSQDLPYPVQLTEGQMTRDPAQLKFEVETAKDPELGAPLRQRQEEQHQVMQHNLDAFIDMTGAQATNMREAGLSVDKALQKQLQADKNKVRVAYAKADKSEEAQAPVDVSQPVQVDNMEPMSVIDYLNSQPDLTTTPILQVAKKMAIETGVAAKGEDGTLIPLTPSVKAMEKWRSEINNNVNYEAPNIRQATILKNMIDAHTQPVEGVLYKTARAERKKLGDQWEKRKIITDLTTNKRGTDDRKVALEDIQKRIIHDGSLDDLRIAKRTLLTSGEEGKQAWRDIQGQTLQEIKKAATAGVAPDGQGNQMVSAAALNKAIKRLDDAGKLDYIFGPQGAEKLRAINEISKTLFTTPTSAAINHSNTAATLAAAMDIAMSGLSGFPAPVATALRLATKHIKDNKVRARVTQALNPSRPNS